MAEIIIPQASKTPLTISSSYYKKADVFLGKKQRLKVYVEDDEDKPFWTKMFGCIEDKRDINISVLQRDSLDAVTKRTGGHDKIPGKDVLMRVNGLSDRKVVAVDADYDLLVDYHSYSSKVRNQTGEDKFVIHTEYYSIENHLIEAESLDTIKISDIVLNIDADSILNKLADCVGNSVKVCVASNIHRQNEYHKGASTLPETLHIKDLGASFDGYNFTSENYEQELANWEVAFESSSTYINILKDCHNEMKIFDGWDKSDVLHNLQGHILYNFISPFLLEKFTREYTQIVNKKRESTEDKRNMPDIISELRQRLGLDTNSMQELIKKTVYNASNLDMKNDAICRIQNNIRAIL